MVSKAIAIPEGPDEHPDSNDDVYVLGWGRMCDQDGKDCKAQKNQANLLQVNAA